MALFFGWCHQDMVDWVEDPRALEALKRYTSPVLKEQYGYKIMVGRQRVRLIGLTTIMKHAMVREDKDVAQFRAAYRRQQRMVERQQGTGRRRRGKTTASQLQVKSSPLAEITGSELGTLVHRQVLDVLTCSTAEQFRGRPGNQWGLHPFVPRIIHLLLKSGIRPVHSDYRIHDTTLKCATEIDIVGVNAQGGIVFIEIKTGSSDGAWTTEKGGEIWFAAPLHRRRITFPCTPKNKAIVQVLMGGEMCMRRFGLPVDTVTFVVLRIGYDGHSLKIFRPGYKDDLRLELYDYMQQVARQIRD